MFPSIEPTPTERRATRAGDDLLSHADVVMDRAFSLDAPPADVWPWLVQLGKGRAGWYLPASVERFLPRGNRAIRHVDPQWLGLEVGDDVPDYGRGATLTLAEVDPPHAMVFTSTRRTVHLTWSLTLEPVGRGTRVQIRLRLGPVKRRWLAGSVGELFDAATIAGMALGLRQRLAETRTAR